MKRIFYIISGLFCAWYNANATPDSLYNNANSFYQEGRYEESIELYESVVVAGYESTSLYYNMGNAYFRSNKLGKARLYYEKALKINPDDEDVITNISYLETLLADRFEFVPEIFFKKWMKSVIVSRSSDSWAYISMASFILSIIAFSAYLLFRNILIRKSGFYGSAILLLVSIFSLTASWKQYQLIISPDSAVVTDLSVNVKSAPRETGTGLFILHEGAKVRIEDKTGGWQEIRLSDGRKGWVPEESIEKI